MTLRKRKQKGLVFQISAFYWSFSSDFMAVKGLNYQPVGFVVGLLNITGFSRTSTVQTGKLLDTLGTFLKCDMPSSVTCLPFGVEYTWACVKV